MASAARARSAARAAAAPPAAGGEKESAAEPVQLPQQCADNYVTLW